VRLQTVGLLLWLIVRIPVAQAQGEPKPLRFDLTPLVGYRTNISFPIQPQVQGTNASVVLADSPSYGLAFGVRIREADVIEFRWARQDSHTSLEDANLNSSRESVTLNQFHADCSHEYIVEDWAQWARPFVMLSIGATHVAASASTNFTRFSFGIGGGVKFYISRHLGLRMQAEWLPVFVNPYGTAICGSSCVVHIGGTLSSQGEVAVGPMLRF
jgi:hypothetical protein